MRPSGRMIRLLRRVHPVEAETAPGPVASPKAVTARRLQPWEARMYDPDARHGVTVELAQRLEVEIQPGAFVSEPWPAATFRIRWPGDARERLVHVVYLLRGARCQGCGATLDLARDWLGMAWRDKLGRHACPTCDGHALVRLVGGWWCPVHARWADECAR